MNDELERIWPDKDRRDVALERVLLRTLAGKVFLVDRLNRPDVGNCRLHRGYGANQNPLRRHLAESMGCD